MKYLVKYESWSLFFRKNKPDDIRYDIVEANSVEDLLKAHNEEQSHYLDGGDIILEIYSLELVYKRED